MSPRRGPIVDHVTQPDVASDDSLQRYIDRGRQRVTLDPRSADQILGYDDDGLPR